MELVFGIGDTGFNLFMHEPPSRKLLEISLALLMLKGIFLQSSRMQISLKTIITMSC